MCWCTPERRTPCCGAVDCKPPAQDKVNPTITIICSWADRFEMANLIGTEYPWPEKLPKITPLPVVVSVDISREYDQAKIELTYGTPE